MSHVEKIFDQILDKIDLMSQEDYNQLYDSVSDTEDSNIVLGHFSILVDSTNHFQARFISDYSEDIFKLNYQFSNIENNKYTIENQDPEAA